MVIQNARFRALFDVADTQRGLVTAQQIAELGIAYSTVTRRVAGGMWTRLLPGVHLVKGGHPLAEQRELAGLLYAGGRSCLTGITGLRRRGYRGGLVTASVPEIEPVHLLIPHEERCKSTGFTRVERTLRMPEWQSIDGLRVAPVARCVADAARRMVRERDVLDLVTSVLQRGMCTHEQLVDELEQGQRRGSAHLRAAVSATSDGVRSPSEADLAALFAAAGIRDVEYNVVLVTSDGEFIAVADAWVDDRLAVEVDSADHHADGSGFRRTVRRNARYAAAGVPWLTVLPVDIRDRPGQVLAWVEASRADAASRPRPAVTCVRGQDRTAWSSAWRWGA